MRWIAAGNVHLTLKFLGDIDHSRVLEIADRMDAATAGMPEFNLVAGGVGVFPNLRRARVLWVGLGGDLERLHELQANVEAGLAAAGFGKASGRFQAHLTIGRTRKRINAQMITASLATLQGLASEPFQVALLMLFQSVLKPAGAEYRRLHTSHLTQMKTSCQ